MAIKLGQTLAELSEAIPDLGEATIEYGEDEDGRSSLRVKAPKRLRLGTDEQGTDEIPPEVLLNSPLIALSSSLLGNSANAQITKDGITLSSAYGRAGNTIGTATLKIEPRMVDLNEPTISLVAENGNVEVKGTNILLDGNVDFTNASVTGLPSGGLDLGEADIGWNSEEERLEIISPTSYIKTDGANLLLDGTKANLVGGQGYAFLDLTPEYAELCSEHKENGGFSNIVLSDGAININANNGTKFNGKVDFTNVTEILGLPSNSGITELTTQEVRIAELDDGIYKWSYDGKKILHYYGLTNTNVPANFNEGETFVFVYGSRPLADSNQFVKYYMVLGSMFLSSDTSMAAAALNYGYSTAKGGSYAARVASYIPTTEAMTLLGTQTVTGNKTFTGAVDFTNATVTGLPSSGGGGGGELTAEAINSALDGQQLQVGGLGIQSDGIAFMAGNINEKHDEDMPYIRADNGMGGYLDVKADGAYFNNKKLATVNDVGSGSGSIDTADDFVWDGDHTFNVAVNFNGEVDFSNATVTGLNIGGGGNSKSFTITQNDLTSSGSTFSLTSDCLTRLTEFASTIDNEIYFEWTFSSSKAYFAGAYEVGTYNGFHGFHLFSATSASEAKIMSLNLSNGTFSGNTSPLNSILYSSSSLAIIVGAISTGSSSGGLSTTNTDEMPSIRLVSNKIENKDEPISTANPLTLTVETSGQLQVGDQLQVCKRKLYTYATDVEGVRTKRYKLRRFAEYVVTEEDIANNRNIFSITIGAGGEFWQIQDMLRSGTNGKAYPNYLRIRRTCADNPDNAKMSKLDVFTVYGKYSEDDQATDGSIRVC